MPWQLNYSLCHAVRKIWMVQNSSWLQDFTSIVLCLLASYVEDVLFHGFLLWVVDEVCVTGILKTTFPAYFCRNAVTFNIAYCHVDLLWSNDMEYRVFNYNACHIAITLWLLAITITKLWTKIFQVLKTWLSLIRLLSSVCPNCL